jgi:hypothetical protein
MQIEDCTATTVINGVNYCILVIHQTSWMDELNSIEPLKVIALLTTTILIWYTAFGVRTVVHTLGSSTKED